MILLAALGAAGGLAQAAPLNAANEARLRSCGSTPPSTPLYYSARLSDAARRLATGTSLQGAVQASGYRAARTTMLHLSGVVSDADIQRVLTDHYCRVLKDPDLKDLGVERRGREVWIVLAGAADVPKLANAAAVQHEILDRVNQARSQSRRCGSKFFEAVPRLSLAATLNQAAFAHSSDMAQHNAFDHQGTDGSSPAQRVERAGYGKHRIVGENIAAGAMSPAEVMQGWLASPGHCENIMDGRFTQIGIAFAENLKTSEGVFWTQDFAAPP